MSLLDRRKPLPRLVSPQVLQPTFIFLWSFIIVWSEIGVFYLSLRSCRWPDIPTQPLDHTSHVLIIADVQVKNPIRVIAPSWTSPLAYLHHLVFELYLRKSWRFAIGLKPDHVIFIGDMTASGRRVASDEEYYLYREAFNKSFSTQDQSVLFHYLPGNNDIGQFEHGTYKVADRAAQNHTLVFLDAPGFVEEDNKRSGHIQDYEPVKGGPMDFIKSINPGTLDHPSILFTHIPLSRPDTASCGPLREKGAIRRGAGTGWQNMIGKKASAFLIEHVKPSLIFSGDDRDYCEYTHHILPADPVREVTVKSFSMARDIRRPGFQLLSLMSPTSPGGMATQSDVPCFFPSQNKLQTSIYLPLAFISLVILIFSNIRQPRRYRTSLTDRNLTLPLSDVSTVWIPSAIPTSPRLSPVGSLSPGIRVPLPNSVSKSYAATPVRRTHSGSPSPLPTPLPFPPSKGEDDDELYPVQYVTRRIDPGSQFFDGAHYNDEDQHKPQSALSVYFPAPNSKYSGRYIDQGSKLPWSFSFVFAGRRRRLTLPSPSGQAAAMYLNAALSLISDFVRGRRVGIKNIWRDILMDCATVFLYALCLWTALAWRTLT